MTSPVLGLMNAVFPKMSAGSEFACFFDDYTRRSVLKGIVHSYYRATDRHVVFDTNRRWTAKAELIQGLFPGAKLLCCVREVGWILDSFERVWREHPLQLSKMFQGNAGSNVYSRTDAMMNLETGVIGSPLASLREAWFGESRRNILIIDYKDLAADPESVLRAVYATIDEPWFPHDYDHVDYDAPEFDAELGMPNLHKVKSKVKLEMREPQIPPELFTRYQDLDFWSNAAN